jgi:hypothetical protein
MPASVEALCEIILNAENNSLHNRMTAAEQLLLFEAPADAAELARTFLTDVFEDPDNHVNQRLEALKIIRRSEARKITQPDQGVLSEHERLEEWRRLLMFERQIKIIKAGIWPLPKGWADDLKSPDFVPPEGDPPRPDVNGLADRLHEARMAFYQKQADKAKRDES